VAGVAELAICAAPDETFGEAVCAVVVLDRDGSTTLDDLAAAAAQRDLAAHKIPTRLVIVDELPRTSAGKVRKRDLRSLL
jgi:non-ribosomal peptide synthetase component E (peptide arylation enzyme)